MKIVLDTNVLMSGIFFSGPPYRILQAWRDGKVQLAVCLEIVAECRCTFGIWLRSKSALERKASYMAFSHIDKQAKLFKSNSRNGS